MSRTVEVVDGIKRMILDGELGPGDRLPVEKDLAEALGVSRGSLREGVRALSILGIVDTRQGDGTYVTSLDPGRLLSPMGFVVDLQGDGSALPLTTCAASSRPRPPASPRPASPPRPSPRRAPSSTRSTTSCASPPSTTSASSSPTSRS